MPGAKGAGGAVRVQCKFNYVRYTTISHKIGKIIQDTALVRPYSPSDYQAKWAQTRPNIEAMLACVGPCRERRGRDREQRG